MNDYAETLAIVKDRMRAVMARVMYAGPQSDGKVQLRDPREASPADELSAMLLPFAPAVDDQVLVLPVSGKKVCLGVKGDSAGPRIYRGSGSPDGAVSAAIGSLYLRTDADNGSQIYIKTAGTGATGWLSTTRAPRRRSAREILTYEGASLATSFVVKGFQNGPTITASATVNADASTGFFLQHNTSSSSGNVASVVAGTNSGVRFDWQPDLSIAIRTPPTITSIRQWYGLFNGDPSASDDPAISGFGFRYSTNASDTTFKAWSNDGTGGGTITDTGVTVNGNTAQDLRAIVNSAVNAIDFYIDGVWVAQHTTNLPAATTVLIYGLYVTTLTAGARAIRWGRITVESRP